MNKNKAREIVQQLRAFSCRGPEFNSGILQPLMILAPGGCSLGFVSIYPHTEIFWLATLTRLVTSCWEQSRTGTVTPQSHPFSHRRPGLWSTDIPLCVFWSYSLFQLLSFPQWHLCRLQQGRRTSCWMWYHDTMSLGTWGREHTQVSHRAPGYPAYHLQSQRSYLSMWEFFYVKDVGKRGTLQWNCLHRIVPGGTAHGQQPVPQCELGP